MRCEAPSIVLTGPNGVGKTNLLEALSFLIPGRGLRRARLKEIQKQNQSHPWALSCQLNDGEGSLHLGTGQDPENLDRRLVRINGEKAKSQTALSEWVSIVWLTPHMDRLFVEGSQGRRRFLDRLVYGLYPGHAQRLNRYEHALRERNLLLRQGGYDGRWMESLEDILVSEGVPLTVARQEVTSQLQGVLDSQDHTFPHAKLSLEGEIETLLRTKKSLEVEDSLREQLAQMRADDRLTGRTGLGPHHSDLIVTYPDKNQAAALCSTGEQKALLLSIIMASAHLLSVRTGAIPLLLLDEVVAHLDENRRASLFDAILKLNMQTWLTGTDVELFKDLDGKAQFIALT